MSIFNYSFSKRYALKLFVYKQLISRLKNLKNLHNSILSFSLFFYQANKNIEFILIITQYLNLAITFLK